MELSDKQKAQFFQRSFKAVDGLWFMKIEKRYGFEKALEIDKAVWEVFPKIQARELKAITREKDNKAALLDCFTTMLNLEGFIYTVEKQKDGGFNIIVTQCAWHDVMVKSGRAHLSGRVGEVICQTEYSTWAEEFGGVLTFSFASKDRLCTGTENCVMYFKE